jgi:SRSO17 transposase
MASAAVVEVEADVLERMQDYVAQLAAEFGLITRHYWAGVYLHGLLLDGERKSIQPLAQRVSVPGWHGDTMQALQQFITDSTWDEQAVLWAYRHLMQGWLVDRAGVIVIDDTGFAKKGRHSVGVARQYSGTLGKTDNCQVAVSLHYCAPRGDYPLALRLYLPESWTSQPERMQAVRVPLAYQTARTKEQIALELLDQVRAEGLRHQAVVADAGYGLSVEFRRGLEERGEVYVVGVTGQEAVFVEPPTWRVAVDTHRGRPPTRQYVRTTRHHRSRSSSSRPVAAHAAQLAARHQRRTAGRVRLAAGVAGAPLAHGRAADDVPDAERKHAGCSSNGGPTARSATRCPTCQLPHPWNTPCTCGRAAGMSSRAINNSRKN